jgi:methionyl-tRNA formyltransferase
VVAVVSQPDRRRGRGRKASPSPVAARALAADVPLLLRPERVGAPEVEQALRDARPDLGVVVAFGQFIPRRIRELPSCGYLLNAHASLLPRLRGAAPIARAILEGERETGISVMRVEREMDAGAVAGVRRTPIGPDENAGELAERLALLAADAIAEAVDAVADGRIRWTPQDEAGATFAPKLTRADGFLDFRAPAEALARRVRALAPRPGATARLEGEPLRILAARARPGPVDAPPGTLRRGEALRIATGDGWLEPTLLQRAGRRPLDVASFLRGQRLDDGMRFDDPPGDEAEG